jgi:D-alanine-D-alanine ligase
MATPDTMSDTMFDAAAAPRGSLRVGLTYDLRATWRARGLSEEDVAEFDSPQTIDALAGTLEEIGHDVDRIGNVHDLVARLQTGDRWDLVFNICEGFAGYGREAQVPALLDAFQIPYVFSDPLVAALTLHKGMTKHVLRDLGLPTAPFAVASSLADLDSFALPFPVLGKPVAEGTSKGIGADAIARDPAALRTLCERLLAKHRQPVLVEAFLPGRELTVGILGTGAEARAVGAMEITLLHGADEGVCTFRNKEDCERLVRYDLATDPAARRAEEIAVAAWRALGARDGGRVDLRADAEGAFQILELNPLPGMHPTHSDLPILWSLGGREYLDLVSAIVASARRRRTEASPALLAASRDSP